MAPSLYEFRTTQEWEQAMQEWCDENEPRYFACWWDYNAGRYGEDMCVPCDTKEEAFALCEKHYDPNITICPPYIRVEIGSPCREVAFITPWGRGGDGKYDRGTTNRFGDYAILRIR